MCIYTYTLRRRKDTIAIIHAYIHIKSQSTFMPLLLEETVPLLDHWLDNHDKLKKT